MPPSISRTPDFSNQFSFPFEILAESLSLIRWWFCWRARARENERRSHEERAGKPGRRFLIASYPFPSLNFAKFLHARALPKETQTREPRIQYHLACELPITKPRVFRLIRQQLVAWRDSGIIIIFEFLNWLLFCKQPIMKKFKEYSKKFHYPRVSPGDQRLTKSRRNSGLEIGELHSSQTQKPTSLPVASALKICICQSVYRAKFVRNHC